MQLATPPLPPPPRAPPRPPSPPNAPQPPDLDIPIIGITCDECSSYIQGAGCSNACDSFPTTQWRTYEQGAGASIVLTLPGGEDSTVQHVVSRFSFTQAGVEAVDRFMSFSLTFMPTGGTYFFNVSRASWTYDGSRAPNATGADATCDLTQPNRRLFFTLPTVTRLPAASKIIFYVTAQCDPDQLSADYPVPVCLDPPPVRRTGTRSGASVGLRDIKLYGWPAPSPPSPPTAPPSPPMAPPHPPGWRPPAAPATSDDGASSSDGATGDGAAVAVRDTRTLLQFGSGIPPPNPNSPPAPPAPPGSGSADPLTPARKYSDLGIGIWRCTELYPTIESKNNSVYRNTSSSVTSNEVYPTGGFVQSRTVSVIAQSQLSHDDS